MIKLNIILIGSAGFIMFLIAAVMLNFAEQLSGSMRYWLTVPPLGVAAYVYVVNLLKVHASDGQGIVPSALMGDVLMATAIAATIFLLFAALMLGISSLIKP